MQNSNVDLTSTMLNFSLEPNCFQQPFCVRGVFSAKGPASSFGGGVRYDCLGDDHMEEEVQVSVQVEE